MSPIEYGGMPLRSEGVWMSVSQRDLADAEYLSRAIADDLELMTMAAFSYDVPLTAIERVTGWRHVTLRSGRRTRYAVGWRAKRQQAEYAAQRERDMAACAYVACTCGHHED